MYANFTERGIGRVGIIRQCDKASFCMVDQDAVVPEEYTTYFRSVIVFGKIRIMEDEAEMRSAIEALAKKYYPDDSEDRRASAIDRERKPLCMMELMVEYLSGKDTVELARAYT